MRNAYSILVALLAVSSPSMVLAQGDELPEWDPTDRYEDFIFEDIDEGPFLPHIETGFFAGLTSELTFYEATTAEPMSLADGTVRELENATRILESANVYALTLGFKFSPVYSAILYMSYSDPTSVLTGTDPTTGEAFEEKAPTDILSFTASFQYRKRVGRVTPFFNAGIGGLFVDSESEDVNNSDLAFNLTLGLGFALGKGWGLETSWRGFFYKWDFESIEGFDQRLGESPIQLMNSLIFGLTYTFQ